MQPFDHAVVVIVALTAYSASVIGVLAKLASWLESYGNRGRRSTVSSVRLVAPGHSADGGEKALGTRAVGRASARAA